MEFDIDYNIDFNLGLDLDNDNPEKFYKSKIPAKFKSPIALDNLFLSDFEKIS